MKRKNIYTIIILISLLFGLTLAHSFTNGAFGCEEWKVKNKDLQIITYEGNTKEVNDYIDWLDDNGWTQIYDYDKYCVKI